MSDTRAIASDDTGVIGKNTPGDQFEDDALMDEEDLGEDSLDSKNTEPQADDQPGKKEKKKSGWLSKLRSGGGDKKETGRLPTPDGPSSADSTEAAVDMLRKMTKKR